MIKRALLKELQSRLIPGQVVVLYGARRVGKTTLLKIIENDAAVKVLAINADNHFATRAFETDNLSQISQTIGDSKLIVIDEAQKIKNIGNTLKLIIDEYPDLRILVSGSASFDLAKQVGEPLTGRKRTLTLYPCLFSELASTPANYHEQLEERLIFGNYPKVCTLGSKQEKIEELQEIIGSYLFKDILELDNLRNADKLKDLVILLALQIGSEVSLSEIGQRLHLHVTTVAHYLDLLEKVFVIYKLRGFSRNLRSEVTKSHKYFFVDNGIRNAIINNFNPLKLRSDIGALWENFMISERLKLTDTNRLFMNRYFWRNYQNNEIDLIEEYDGKLFATEFKWQDRKANRPKEFLANYPDSEFQIINKENYIPFLKT